MRATCLRHDKDLSTSCVFTAGNICDEIASGSRLKKCHTASHADFKTVYSGSTHQADRRCIRGVRLH